MIDAKLFDQILGIEAVYNNAALEKQEYAKVEKLMGLFNIPSEDLLTGSYREMVLNRS